MAETQPHAEPDAGAGGGDESGGESRDESRGAPRDRRAEPLISLEGLAGVTRALAWLLALGGAGLAVTGLPLIWLYQPDPRGGGRGDFWWLRGAHSTMSMVFVGAAAGTVAVLAVAAARRLGVRVPPGWFVALAVLVVALVGLLSGQLIAWDSLTFGPVGVSDPRGVAGALSGDVRLIFVDGSEVSRRAYAAWAGVHVLAVPLLALGVAWIVRRRA